MGWSASRFRLSDAHDWRKHCQAWTVKPRERFWLLWRKLPTNGESPDEFSNESHNGPGVGGSGPLESSRLCFRFLKAEKIGRGFAQKFQKAATDLQRTRFMPPHTPTNSTTEAAGNRSRPCPAISEIRASRFYQW